MSFFGLGPTELIIILVVVVVLFAPGRVGKMLGELGTGLRSLRDGLSSDPKDDAQKTSPDANIEPK